jgi:hypothetical protein
MSDFRDKRGGAYDPVTSAGNPQPPQVRDKATPHQKAQWGAGFGLSRSLDPQRAIRYQRVCGSREWDRSTRIREADRKSSLRVGGQTEPRNARSLFALFSHGKAASDLN